MAKHIPMRLCIGCRTRETIDNLVRVAFDQTDDSRSLVFDQRRKGKLSIEAPIQNSPPNSPVVVHRIVFAQDTFEFQGDLRKRLTLAVPLEKYRQS